MVGQIQTQTLLERNAITLQGSAQIVAEFFQYAVNRSGPARRSAVRQHQLQLC